MSDPVNYHFDYDAMFEYNTMMDRTTEEVSAVSEGYHGFDGLRPGAAHQDTWEVSGPAAAMPSVKPPKEESPQVVKVRRKTSIYQRPSMELRDIHDVIEVLSMYRDSIPADVKIPTEVLEDMVARLELISKEMG